MHPLVRGAAAAAILTGLGSFHHDAPPPVPAAAPRAEVRGIGGLPAPCGPGTLPEGPVCIRIPSDDGGSRPQTPSAADLAASPDVTAPGPSRSRAALGSDRIPRRPERPADAAAYVWPVGEGRAPRLIGGGDELPGVRLAARPGEKVLLMTLEHQVGPAEVVFVGELQGPTVVTAHVVDEGGRQRTYLLFHARLDHAEAGVAAGSKLEGGATLGFAPREAGGALIEIYVEARVVQEGSKLAGIDAKRLSEASTAAPIDVRNVLPLRANP